MASRSIRSFTTENERTSRQLVRQIQALLTLLSSLSSERESSSDAGNEPKDFEVYDDDAYRYVSLKLPDVAGQDIDLNIHDQRLFVRIEL